MKKNLILLSVLLCLNISLTACNNSSNVKEANPQIKIEYPEKFGRYMDNNQIMGLFVSKNEKEIKMKVQGETISFKIPEGYYEKRLPKEIQKDKVIVITYTEENDVKIFDKIELVNSMRNQE